MSTSWGPRTLERIWTAARPLSAGSIWLTELGLRITTVSLMMGHSNPAFTLKCYGRDPREEQAIVADVLERMTKAATGLDFLTIS